MKNRSACRAIVLILLLCTLALMIASCGKEPDTEQGKNDNTTQTIDRTQPSAGTYKIQFYLGNTPNYITHYYNKGETITPPTDIPAYITTRETFYFDGWDGVEFGIVEKDAKYQSAIRREYNYYTATFCVDEQKIEKKTICGDYPKAPDETELQLAQGENFVMWDTVLEAFTRDVTITAITTRYFDKAYFAETYNKDLLIYTSSVDKNDSENQTLENATALACLLYEENQNPKRGAVARRIVEHLTAVVSKEQAPAFDACCYWSYAVLAGSVSLAKATPSVWNIVPSDIKLRLDVMMRAFAYLASFATSDDNQYLTGPGMKGNYSKVWNPNYRLANIPIIVYCTHYFGNGDMHLGVDTVNSILKGFNENEYNDMVNLFSKYGWRRALITWTAEARTSTDGRNIQGKSAKELLLYGGQAVGEDTSKISDLLVPLGNGKGVTNGGNDYHYGGYGLDECDSIIRAMIRCNYGNDKGLFNEVKSDHWYDKDGDGVKDIVAWINGDLTSPYQGQYGMMREFASGDRSSAGYCKADFLLVNTMIYTCKLLKIYDLWTDDYTDANGISIREAVLVGNEDFLFKVENGYIGYATGSYGGYVSEYFEVNEDKGSYFSLKHFWRNHMLPSLEQTLSVS
ncbi:MAG: hypothetical protein IKC72_04545 [Clostridia bacterium]|nr:hypothetical protein [Clostridia bacterium]